MAGGQKKLGSPWWECAGVSTQSTKGCGPFLSGGPPLLLIVYSSQTYSPYPSQKVLSPFVFTSVFPHTLSSVCNDQVPRHRLGLCLCKIQLKFWFLPTPPPSPLTWT